MIVYIVVLCGCVLMCLKPRQIVDKLNRDITYETYNEELDNCDNVDYGDAISVEANELVILQLNVRGLYSKLDQIKSLLNYVTCGRKPDILLLCKTWQSKNSPTPNLNGYDYVYKALTHKLGGGVGIFVSNNLKHKPRPDLEIDLETLEHCIIELILKSEKLLVCSGYRPPGQNPSKFVDKYEQLITHMSNTGIPVLIGLDHNLDLLKHKNHNPTMRFVEKNLDLNMVPCIMKPTRITKSSATLIDNIFVPLNLVPNVSSYIIIDDMSDHLPIVMKLSDVQLAEKDKIVIESHDLRPKNVKLLKETINNHNWDELLSDVIPCNDQVRKVIPQNVLVNDMFDRFHSKMLDMINEHVPLKVCTIISRKFRREPWLTNGFYMSIAKSKKLYKLSIRKGSTDSELEQYRHYRNCLN